MTTNLSSLAVNAQIVRFYADAVRKVFASMPDQDGAAGEAVRVLLGMADATATCAEGIAKAQAQMLELTQIFGHNTPQPRQKLTIISGGKD